MTKVKKNARRRNAALRARILELEAENADLREELDLELGAGGGGGHAGPMSTLLEFLEATGDCFVPGFHGEIVVDPLLTSLTGPPGREKG